ncbi:hypothetical protein [Nocardia sp. NPDC050412]|uniref:MmyB family transcriptional regulator n=1 Tax=Nocardia sp. NPDC050412 TaxID=3364320 RepID=UPI003792D128
MRTRRFRRTRPRNVARGVFLNPKCCNIYRNDEDDLRRMAGFLRRSYAKNLCDPAWQDFISESYAASETFDSLRGSQ